MRFDLPFHATLADYESVRANSSRFLIAPEHWLPEVESVTEKTEGWWVVEKHGEAAELAEELDPRTDGENGD